MEMIEISIEEAAHLIGKGKEELTGSENPVEFFKTSLADKIKRIQTDAAAQSLKNGLEKREKLLAQKFNVESFSGWDDLIEQISAKSTQTEGNTETAEKLKRLTEQNADYRSQLKAAKQETENVKREYESRAILANVTAKTKQHIEGLNLNLPTDPQQRARAIDRLISMELQGKKFQQKGDSFVVLDENGQTIHDSNYNDLTAIAMVEKTFLEMYQPITPQNNNRSTPPTPDGKQTIFAAADLTPEGYLIKAQELKKAGDKETLNLLNAEYREKHNN